jgi:hypothetical protein
MNWYRARFNQSRLGAVLATVHFGLVFVLLAGICISPSNDWPWWVIVPFALDVPFSFVIDFVSDLLLRLVLLVPHGAFEGWLSRQREPFSSFDLFWLPAGLYLFLGTAWHYYWPQLPRLLRWTRGRRNRERG